jgi:hypothetical protein
MEANLLLTYFQKAHNYRYNVTPSAFSNRGIAYDGFSYDSAPPLLEQLFNFPTQCTYGDAMRTCAAVFSGGTANLDVGDAFERKYTKSYILGFLGGSGLSDRISALYPYLEHTSAGLQSATPAKVGFLVLLGSYFGDWNLTDDFLRAAIATPTIVQPPTYGLAAMWVGGQPVYWELVGLGLGETLGECARTTVNTPMLPHDDSTGVTKEDNARWLTIHGDPTLRLNVFTPPSSLSARRSNGNVSLIWAGDPQGQYQAYGGLATSGPFTRLTTTPVSPVSGLACQVADNPGGPVYSVFMVRGVRTEASGCGTYANLSQGAIAVATQH